MATTKSSPTVAVGRNLAPPPQQPPATSNSSNNNNNNTLHAKTLTFEKKNTNLLKIPHNYRIQKRPIPHTPVASPYAGSNVAKVVYVSSRTPVMSAVKRVLKLLRLAERRAMMPVIDEKQQRKQRQRHQQQQQQQQQGKQSANRLLEQCQQRLRQDKVLVKATGRAIEKALAVGRFFNKGKGPAQDEEYEVVVRTGSVCVVDDIVGEDDEGDDYQIEDGDEDDMIIEDDTVVVVAAAADDTNTNDENAEATAATKDAPQPSENTPSESKNQRRRRRKRERVQQQRLNAFKDDDGEPPESRTRWVNMVEISINIK